MPKNHSSFHGVILLIIIIISLTIISDTVFAVTITKDVINALVIEKEIPIVIELSKNYFNMHLSKTIVQSQDSIDQNEFLNIPKEDFKPDYFSPSGLIFGNITKNGLEKIR